MRKLFLLFLLLALFPSLIYGATAADLIEKLRERTGETKASTSFFQDSTALSWLDMAQSKIVRIGGFIPKMDVITIPANDSGVYDLPSDFNSIDGGAMVKKTGYPWQHMRNNPLFAIDTISYQFFVKWADTGQAQIYVKGAMLTSGDVIRVFYFGAASELTSTSSPVNVRRDLHPYIVEEALSFYFGAIKQAQVHQEIWTETRTDLGVIERGEQK